MADASEYFIRHGTMGRVGRFRAESGAFRRGERVVIQSRRGVELGEVLAEAASSPTAGPASASVLRAAGPDDLERARLADLERPGRLAACEQVFRDGLWPLELIDVEPLLDGRRTVLHYLGPHHLDADGLLQTFRDRFDLDIVLEPAGIDADDRDTADPPSDQGCGSCGADGSCGSGGGGCGSSHGDHGGCSSCAVKDLVSRRRAVATS